MTEQDFVDRISLLWEESIVDINLEGVDFTNAQETYLFHDALDRAVTETGRTWFFLTCFTGCTITPEAAEQFSMRRTHSHINFSRGAVRYGASDELDRAMTTLGSNAKAVKVSFNTREEALQKIEEIRNSGAWETVPTRGR